MNPILYFLPGKHSTDQIREILPGRFTGPGASIAIRQTTKGPLEFPAGLVIGRTDKGLALDVQTQTWHRSGCGQFAFGWPSSSPPTPDSLARPEMISGQAIAGGWIIPRVRRHHLDENEALWTYTLPKRMEWTGTQYMPGKVVQRFADVVTLCEEVSAAISKMWEDWQADPEAMRFLPDAAPELAGQIIQINYAIGHDEIAALEIFEASFKSLETILEIFTSRDQLVTLLIERAAQLNEEKKTALPASV